MFFIFVSPPAGPPSRNHPLLLRLSRQPDDPVRALLDGLALEPLRVSGEPPFLLLRPWTEGVSFGLHIRVPIVVQKMSPLKTPPKALLIRIRNGIL